MGKSMVSSEQQTRMGIKGNYWHDGNITHLVWGSLEKAMASHSSTGAWKIPWMEEPGGLQSMGLLRVRHD